MITLGGIDILWPAFIAGLLVLGSHVPLGRQVLRRGIIFIDLAVAQAAATGALASQLLLAESSPLYQQAGALLAALLTAVLLHQLARRHEKKQEALIGGCFVLLASLAVLLASHDPHGSEHLHAALSGQILWVSGTQLLWLAAASATAILLMRFTSSELLNFYLPLAIAVTAAVQSIGVYLVFACLIFPAMAVSKMSPRGGLITGILIGIMGIAGGLLLSLSADLPSGPITVITIAVAALLSTLRPSRRQLQI